MSQLMGHQHVYNAMRRVEIALLLGAQIAQPVQQTIKRLTEHQLVYLIVLTDIIQITPHVQVSMKYQLLKH